MTENRESSSRIEQKLQAYYEVQPRQDFLPSLKRELLERGSARATIKRNQFTLPALSRYPTFALVALALVLCVIVFTTSPGQALAQQLLKYFNRAESDTLPVQSWQLAPLPSPGTPTPDSSSILDAQMTVKEVEEQVPFNVQEPSWLPDGLSFAGASIEPEHNIVRIFYRSVETNGLILREEPFQQTNDCELCGEVGASAAVESVQIGEIEGEFVEGVWKLTDNGPVWESDPYIKTLRWRSSGIAFELQFMGSPESVTKADLIAIAASMK